MNRWKPGPIVANGLDQDISIAGDVGLVGQEVPDCLLLLLRVRWNAVMGQAIAPEEVRNQHHGIQARGQKVRTLQSLVR